MPVGANRAGIVSQVGDAIPDSELLQNRYDARELSLNDGDTINPFTDLKGDTDLDETGAPQYDADAINSKAGSSYDGSKDNHFVTFSSVSQPFVWAWVMDIRSVADNDNEFYIDDESIKLGTRVLNNQGEWQMADGDRNTNGGAISTGNKIVVAVFDGSSSKLRVNGSDEITLSTSDSNGGLMFAGLSNGGNNAPISIGEFLLYDGSPTVGDIESYLSNKWGIPI